MNRPPSLPFFFLGIKLKWNWGKKNTLVSWHIEPNMVDMWPKHFFFSSCFCLSLPSQHNFFVQHSNSSDLWHINICKYTSLSQPHCQRYRFSIFVDYKNFLPRNKTRFIRVVATYTPCTVISIGAGMENKNFFFFDLFSCSYLINHVIMYAYYVLYLFCFCFCFFLPLLLTHIPK